MMQAVRFVHVFLSLPQTPVQGGARWTAIAPGLAPFNCRRNRLRAGGQLLRVKGLQPASSPWSDMPLGPLLRVSVLDGEGDTSGTAAHAMIEKQDGKWRGTVTGVISAPIDKVWAILADFDGLQKNFPQVFDSCHTVEGEKNKVGSLRAVVAPLPNGLKVGATERLLACDDVTHTTSYTIEKIDLGWTGYENHISAESVENGHTLVVWSFELDPIGKVTEEKYLLFQKGHYQKLLQLTKGIVSK